MCQAYQENAVGGSVISTLSLPLRRHFSYWTTEHTGAFAVVMFIHFSDQMKSLLLNIQLFNEEASQLGTKMFNYSIPAMCFPSKPVDGGSPSSSSCQGMIF